MKVAKTMTTYSRFDNCSPSEFEEEETNGGGRDYLQSPMSDGTIEEDFEEALAKVASLIVKDMMLKL